MNFWLLFGILGFGVMVFVHELGHFLAAKRLGIQVETFSLGWGPRLVGFTRKGTEYRLSVIPFGGFCKMKGELPIGWVDAGSGAGGAGMAGRGTEAARDRPAEPGSFFGAPPWKRIVVGLCGPLANVLFAVLVLTAVWWIGFRVYSPDNRILLYSDFREGGFSGTPPATRAGLATGDRVLAIDGRPIVNYQELRSAVSQAPEEELAFTVERSGRLLQIPVRPELDKQSGAGLIGVLPWEDPVVDRVQPGGAGALAGLRPGDRIVAAGGVPVEHLEGLLGRLRERPASLELEVLRGGERLHLPLLVRYGEQGALEVGFSFKLNQYPSPRVGPAGALRHGLRETGETIQLTVKGIGLLFRGVSLRRAVAGPLQITKIISDVAASGFQLGVGQGVVNYVRLLCLLSIVLFLMNLLPIPALDGGQILLSLVEVARRRPVSLRIVARIQVVSFSVLMVIALAVTANDILGFLGR